MDEDRFGYDEKVPENIRNILMMLCKDVWSLQAKWDFYQGLFGKEENTDLLFGLVPASLNIIEESLRNDITMAICRLSDPTATKSKDNLSFATLVKKCPEFPGLEKQLSNFQDACKPLRKHRDKVVGHNDLKTRIRPREYPLPGITKDQIDEVMKLAVDFVQPLFLHYTNITLIFQAWHIGGADDLIFWLNEGREHNSGKGLSLAGE